MTRMTDLEGGGEQLKPLIGRRFKLIGASGWPWTATLLFYCLRSESRTIKTLGCLSTETTWQMMVRPDGEDAYTDRRRVDYGSEAYYRLTLLPEEPNGSA